MSDAGTLKDLELLWASSVGLSDHKQFEILKGLLYLYARRLDLENLLRDHGQDAETLEDLIKKQTATQNPSDEEIAMMLAALSFYNEGKLSPREGVEVTTAAVDRLAAANTTPMLGPRRRAIFAARAASALGFAQGARMGAISCPRSEIWQSIFLAVCSFLDADLNEAAEEAFDSLRHSPAPRDGDDVRYLADRLTVVGPSLEARRGDYTVDKALKCWAQILPLSKSEEPLYACQAVKGALLSASIADPAAAQWQDDPTCLRQLAEIEKLRSDAMEADSREGPIGSDELETSLLFSYTESVLRYDNRSPLPLREAEVNFDRYIFGRAGRKHRIPFQLFLSLEQIQDLIGSDTILISYLNLPDTSENGKRYNRFLDLAVVVTSETLQTFILQDPRGFHIVPGGDGQSWDRHHRSVMDLRTALRLNQKDQAGELIRKLSDHFLPIELLDYLESVRRHRRHLVIHPHRTMHFCPWTILGSDSPLADDWIVTFLPTIGLLKRRNGALAAPADTSLAAFGISFQNKLPFDLPPLPRAADEARYIARALGTRPCVDQEATKAALMEGLRTKRFVHLATHGSHRAGAPSFQRVYLWPDEDSDGILNAYEVLGESFDQLDLVSLSACETALGRFDQGDNLRGLCSSLLIAGANSIVSTLWPIADDAAAEFYEALYDGLASGQSKLIAFQAAQRDVRERYPYSAEWSAFHFSGIW